MALPDSKIGEMIRQRKEQHSWYFTPTVMCPKPFVRDMDSKPAKPTTEQTDKTNDTNKQ